MERISEMQLNALCDRLNEVTGSPMQAWRKVDEKYVANIGNYHISFAYGGVCLHRMTNESGGVRSVFGIGHVPKRELWNQMHAFLAGLTARETA